MEELLKEIKEHYIEQPNVKRGKFYIEALTLEKIIKDWLAESNQLESLVSPPSDSREKDIQELCRQVLNCQPEVYYNPNGADITTCPFCINKVENSSGDMEEISHDINCAYNIAKDLSTNFERRAS